MTLREIAARTEVSTATVRVALGRVAPRTAGMVEPLPAPGATDGDVVEPADDRDDVVAAAELVVLAAPVPRTR